MCVWILIHVQNHHKKTHSGCSNCQEKKLDRCIICDADGKCPHRKYKTHRRYMYEDKVEDKNRYKCNIEKTFDDQKYRRCSRGDTEYSWINYHNNRNIKKIGVSDSKIVYVLEKYSRSWYYK